MGRGHHFYRDRNRPVAARGEGGDPPTPPPSFFKEGVTPPPMCRGRWGVPPPPLWPGPARSREQKNHAAGIVPSEIPQEHTSVSRAKMASISFPVEGGDPPTPPSTFFQRGDHPPTHMPGQWGGTPYPHWSGPSGVPQLSKGNFSQFLATLVCWGLVAER